MFGPINITIPERRWPLSKKVAAITLWPFVVYREGHRTPALEAHEQYHWHQALRWGVIPWYVAYVALALLYRTGGRRHPMERRAYEVADKVDIVA